MNRATTRLRLALAMLAWLAQLCLPLAHAAAMGGARGGMPAWCGDPVRAIVVAAALPAEIREGLGLDGLAAEHALDCATLCAAGSTPTPLPSSAIAPRPAAAADDRAALPQHAAPRLREQSPTPPAQAPPPRG